MEVRVLLGLLDMIGAGDIDEGVEDRLAVQARLLLGDGVVSLDPA